MSVHRPRLPSAVLLSAALAAWSAGTVFAESPCKGLEQGICEGKTGCLWVDGYTRKDGKTVASHCKSGGKKGSPTATKDLPASADQQASKGKE